jgi:hypothetical protein
LRIFIAGIAGINAGEMKKIPRRLSVSILKKKQINGSK